MTAQAAAIITKDRVRVWQKTNERKGLAITPVLLVNVGHGEQNGQIHLNVTEDMPMKAIVAFLEAALAHAKSRAAMGE